MLYRLEIENFYSIRHRQIIDLRARADADTSSGHLAPIWPGSHEKAPKVIVLFGANGSGKTTVLRALTFLKWFVKDSFSLSRNDRMPFERFNDSEMQTEKMRICVHFGGLSSIDQAGGLDAPFCEYIYQFVIDGPVNQNVYSESLYYKSPASTRSMKLFERSSNGSITSGRSFGMSGYKTAIDKILRPNVSAISTLSQLNHPYSAYIVDLCSRIISNMFVDKFEDSDEQTIQFYDQNPQFVELLNKEIQRIDLGVRSMILRPGPVGPVAWFEHRGLERLS